MEFELEYTLCHGSGNRFVLIDGIRFERETVQIDPARLAQETCRPGALRPGGLDGLLLLLRTPEGDCAMRMFNTDGSEAGMCGNGIRCVARMARERYLAEDDFALRSGGRRYPIRREKPISEGLPTYGVEIGIRLAGDDFPQGGPNFIAAPIPELDENLRFTYLDLGNPHITAETERIDYALLSRLGERVKQLPAQFPHGVNVSLVRRDSEQRIFVATCERGVGLTDSCGTAMTASATAMWLTGRCPADRKIEVFNRGGMVRCAVHPAEGSLSTRLTGNATFEESGRLTGDGVVWRHEPTTEYAAEKAAYERFATRVTKPEAGD